MREIPITAIYTRDKTSLFLDKKKRDFCHVMFRPKFWENNSQSVPEKSAVPIIIIKTSRFDRKYFQNGFQYYLQGMQSRKLVILSVK